MRDRNKGGRGGRDRGEIGGVEGRGIRGDR